MDDRYSVLSKCSATNAGLSVLLAFGSVAAPAHAHSYHAAPLRAQIRSWEGSASLVTVAATREQIWMNFCQRVIEGTVEPDPRFDEFVAEHLAELL